jgi:uncharacterized protein
MSKSSAYTARFIDSVSAVNPADWNALLGTEYPFHRHEFLSALEASGCIGGNTGWTPLHLILERNADEQLVAVMPLYQKTNSEGEFVFDFSWARAYYQAGLEYYPKLVAAVPFTPVTCNCILYASDCGETPEYLRSQLIHVATEQAKAYDISSLHLLFPTAAEQIDLASLGLLMRKDCQFHWHNADYTDFDDFLNTFKSKKRKEVRRERRKVSDAGIRYQVLGGTEMTDAIWDQIAPLYSRTFLLRGRPPYLTPKFFKQLSRTLPSAIVVVIGYLDETAVATAICFRSATALYGRYWGSAGDFDSLHFETCYYQGIDYCIREKLELFEPGTQGEHKIARGFRPTQTASAHWISDPRFAAAIDNYLQEEGRHIDSYMQSLQQHVPYKDPDTAAT